MTSELYIPTSGSSLHSRSCSAVAVASNDGDSSGFIKIANRKYRKIIKLILDNGIVKQNQPPKCPFVLQGKLILLDTCLAHFFSRMYSKISDSKEIFWPILARDTEMVDQLLLAGCDCHAQVTMYGLRFSGIHLAAETHPKIISSLLV